MLSNPSQFRRTAAGVALIVAPLLFLIADIISPAWSDDTAEYVREVADNTGAQNVSSLLYVIGFTLFVPGVIGIMHLIRGRGVTLAHIATALAVIGLGAFPALGALGIVDALAVETLNEADHVALVESAEDEWAPIALLIIILIPALLSLILIAAALWRSGLTPVWVAIVVIASALLLVVGNSQALSVAADALMLVGFGFVGLRLLKMGNDVWDRPPHDWRESAPAAAPPAS
jgi:hypothetical protein